MCVRDVNRYGACAHCQLAIGSQPGKFSGSYIKLGTGELLHAECREAHSLASGTSLKDSASAGADVCATCGQGIAVVPGKFCGKFVTMSGKKYHQECMGASDTSCAFCHKPFESSFLKFPDGAKVHKECKDDYSLQKADKCAHCGKGIAAAGPFSGGFFRVGEQKVHSECKDAFQS
mmetsp:Transcript_6270/g.15451  ORF Transcript_6270/g.15451 Transcript_6270/m.15451 type:complete len:176 (+) Transcript_6270:247-774(+)